MENSGDIVAVYNEDGTYSIFERTGDGTYIMLGTDSDSSTTFIFYNGIAPSLAGNIAIVTCFVFILIFQILFGLMRKQWWFLTTWFIGLVLEVTGYTGRALSHNDINNKNYYIMQSSSIVLAPLFLLAGIYFLLGQLVVIMGKQFSRLKPARYSAVFITFDLIALGLQGYGGGAVVNSDNSSDEKRGNNIMLGGLIFQLCSMTLFLFLYADFLIKCRKEEVLNAGINFDSKFTHVRAHKWFPQLLSVIGVSMLFIYVRSVYRIIELADGPQSDLVTNEAYFLPLEGAMIVCATLTLTIFHPGMIYGKGTKITVTKWFRNKEKSEESFVARPVGGGLEHQEKGH